MRSVVLVDLLRINAAAVVLNHDFMAIVSLAGNHSDIAKNHRTFLYDWGFPARDTLIKGSAVDSALREYFFERREIRLNQRYTNIGTMQNLISHFLLKNTVCLRVSESEMYQLFLHSSLANKKSRLFFLSDADQTSFF
jgi:hypothetical protein